MPIQVTADADIVDRYGDVAVVDIFERYAFVDDRAVSRAAFERVAHDVRRCQNIMEPTQLAKIERLGKMKSEKIVLDGGGNEIEKPNLVPDLQPRVGIFNFGNGQMGLFQYRLELHAGLFGMGVGEPRYAAAGGRQRVAMRGLRVMHDGTLSVP